MDEDGSGTISLDEFITFFGAELDDNAELAAQDSMLQDELWPSWVMKEKKLSEMETMLSAIFKHL